MFTWQFFFDDTGPPFNDFIYWMIPFWLNLSYSIHSLQRLFTYNLRHFSLATSNHCSADGNVRGLPRILKSRSRILECMLTKKVGFELGAWSKHYLALISPWVRSRSTKKEAGGLSSKKNCQVNMNLSSKDRFIQTSETDVFQYQQTYFLCGCLQMGKPRI